MEARKLEVWMSDAFFDDHAANPLLHRITSEDNEDELFAFFVRLIVMGAHKLADEVVIRDEAGERYTLKALSAKMRRSEEDTERILKTLNRLHLIQMRMDGEIIIAENPYITYEEAKPGH